MNFTSAVACSLMDCSSLCFQLGIRNASIIIQIKVGIHKVHQETNNVNAIKPIADPVFPK